MKLQVNENMVSNIGYFRHWYFKDQFFRTLVYSSYRILIALAYRQNFVTLSVAAPHGTTSIPTLRQDPATEAI